MFELTGNLMFSVMPILFFVVFTFVIAMFIVTIFKGIKQWNYNNAQPVLNVEAKVVGKKIDISRHHHNNNGHTHHHTSSSYYVTFEVESGDRMELKVPSKEYGLIAENDIGKLRFQGTRYIGFERAR